MPKKQIKLTEQALRQLVEQTVKTVLKEDYYGDPDDKQDEDLSGELDIQLTQRDLSNFRKTIPGGYKLINKVPRGVAIRVFYSSYGDGDVDIHNVRILDKDIRGWGKDKLITVPERKQLEAAFLEYGKKGGFDHYIFGDEGNDFDSYEEYEDGALNTNYNNSESSDQSPEKRKDNFLAGGF